ncbi:hypothetical protein [Paractinoplanes atraurantiacus]|uniref:Uncharacterized protein n=1 Tax=Paractinoplanes atraurantiacus TaxID=1036182 RepID=A0A285JWK4_9ACTN|nr:hypothetical protein [Actinoplanes atraurantiacus]SNY64699.1 hypothetical protein SAMN05421748_12723 [Actinoplanes atraurantiacus]
MSLTTVVLHPAATSTRPASTPSPRLDDHIVGGLARRAEHLFRGPST